MYIFFNIYLLLFYVSRRRSDKTFPVVVLDTQISYHNFLTRSVPSGLPISITGVTIITRVSAAVWSIIIFVLVSYYFGFSPPLWVFFYFLLWLLKRPHPPMTHSIICFLLCYSRLQIHKSLNGVYLHSKHSSIVSIYIMYYNSNIFRHITTSH